MLLQDDKLNRNDFIKRLFDLFKNFGNQNGHGLTIALNGKFGAGKSTLLDFIIEKNDKEDTFEIIKYNAWKDALYKEPLIPILKCVSEIKPNGEKVKESAIKVFKNVPSVLFNMIGNKVGIDTDKLFESSNIFKEYDDYNKAVSEFKDTLTKYCENKKVIFLVDELDRCLPEYQIKVLEILYHLLDIPNLIIVIALDKTQLEHAIKNKFGEDTNTSGYLAKFIQYEIDLPNDEARVFYESILTFNCLNNELAKLLISKLLELEKIPLRESQLLINDVNIICNEKNERGENVRYYTWYPVLVAMLRVLKSKYRDIYYKYFGKVKEAVFDAERELQLNATPYYAFLNEIKNTAFKEYLDFLNSVDYNSKMTLLVFIDSFLDITHIRIKELSNYTELTDNIIEDHIHWKNGADFPKRINKLVKKLEIVGIN